MAVAVGSMDCLGSPGGKQEGLGSPDGKHGGMAAVTVDGKPIIWYTLRM
ncbi:MAG: hypothetical protein K6F51_02870 [Acetatifactor sp.]|nr:hypothetical protein [Acetatifactor sp.]